MIREDMAVFRKVLVPTADAIQEVAGKMAAFLSVQYIPLPREDLIIERIVDILRLPGEEFRLLDYVVLKFM